MSDVADLADLKARADAARDFSVPIEGRNFTLRVPTGFELVLTQRSADQMAGLGAKAASMVLERLLTHAAIVGWAGVTVEDILPGQPDGEKHVPYDVRFVDLLLDARPKWAAKLAAELLERIIARTSALAADAKN